MKARTGVRLVWGAALAITVVLTGLALAGCSKKTEQYGEKLSLTEVTPVSDILSNPASFEGRTVRIEGEITRECPTGCWFDLTDTSAAIYVDIEPQGLAIPQHVGRKIAVEGTVSTRNGQTEFLGKGVEIQ
jgi:RecJ-like exonuclease